MNQQDFYFENIDPKSREELMELLNDIPEAEATLVDFAKRKEQALHKRNQTMWNTLVQEEAKYIADLYYQKQESGD